MAIVNNREMVNEQKKLEDEGGEMSGIQESEHKMMSFSELYEQSLQEVPLGEVVTGRVVQLGNDVVMVDVGYKTEGQIPAAELKDENGNFTISVGDMIEVLVDRKDEEYNLILSRDKATRMRMWNEVKKACETNGLIKGTITERVKGGFSVDIGITAFLPGSQVDVRPVKDMNSYIGQVLQFNILSYDRKRNNVVLSRRSILEKEREAERKMILESIEEGKILEGLIKNITDYGVFIDLGGIDGLLHVTDISWGKISRPSDSFSKGDKISVKVLSFDREKGRISLGLKQLKENPWDGVLGRYPVGSVSEGKVVSIMDYGAFVELEEGVEGLIHISEMFWTTKKFRHPSKILNIGDQIKVMVLDINPEAKRISLGLKQTVSNPWMILKDKYPPGTVVKGVVRNIADFGIFVGVEEGIEGLVHVSDISWKQRVKHPSEFFKKGQEIEAVVLNIDVENEKFSLGIKQLEKNPWEEVASRYNQGSVITGKITNVTDFGLFVEIEEGIEGLIHVSEIGNRKVKSPSEIYNVGDAVSAMIKNIDPRNKKIRLSIKDYESSMNEVPSNQYINNQEKVASNLGKALANIKVSDV
ncbi:MAG: 30S ribosomal protein S1 [Syntrophales bacterium]|nr:30S ribosomal protein S1 [Syntrophales bacterium]